MTLTIGLLLPDVLGTYGDDGNALVLRQRARLRGIDADIHRITLQDAIPDSCDLYCMGGGEDAAQVLAAEHLRAHGGLIRAAEKKTPILSICAGFQVLGESFHASGGVHEGLGLIDATTAQLRTRAIGEVEATPSTVLTEQISDAQRISGTVSLRLSGFENHMGSTVLGPDAQPLCSITRGVGNTDSGHGAGCDGAIQGTVIATYMHGPFLARNPHIADLLLARAMGVEFTDLEPLVLDEVSQLREERLED
ncbi:MULTISPECIES: type 1 glutamine amidotransferase [unclassified Corynebacterium]|uniref:type 1 glutamine amidotransferase n=1 Tax=unclassified Corynebacterium TaxID=2624378 RepID=UPI001C45CC67|nr:MULTISPECIES: glutamine amidotransferase [unclassified Corynebacterium]MBV7282211.1 glutamine amidotransferase [Corynebacterium sp. TAE3-ERU30]MBV7302448.1 glutamine amidotransferase [Corynebacterium sp. TAE3-ERU2]